MLIAVLLAPDSRDYGFPRLIRAGPDWPISFGFICEDMPLKSEVAFGAAVARRTMTSLKCRSVMNAIESSVGSDSALFTRIDP